MIDVPAGHLYLGGAIGPTSRERTAEAVLLDASGTDLEVPLEKSDIRVTALSLVWVPAR